MSLIIFYPFAMHLKHDYASAGETRPFYKNSDQTVMRQWWDIDATVIEQWCLWVRLFYVIFKVLRCHWSYFILLQCIWSVIMHLLGPFDKNGEQTFDLSKFMSLSRLWDVIDQFLSFCNALEVLLCICWWHKTIWQKQWTNSDETVMEQWCNSDVSELSSFRSFSSLWDVIDYILSFCHALEVLLLIWWWNKTYCQWQSWDIDETLMRQWWNSDGTVMLLI
jgi:hypothetical protein